MGSWRSKPVIGDITSESSEEDETLPHQVAGETPVANEAIEDAFEVQNESTRDIEVQNSDDLEPGSTILSRSRMRSSLPSGHIGEVHLQRNRKRIKKCFLVNPESNDETMEFRRLVENEEERAREVAREADLAALKADRASKRSYLEGLRSIPNKPQLPLAHLM